jgi:hypothetical protein
MNRKLVGEANRGNGQGTAFHLSKQEMANGQVVKGDLFEHEIIMGAGVEAEG